MPFSRPHDPSIPPFQVIEGQDAIADRQYSGGFSRRTVTGVTGRVFIVLALCVLCAPPVLPQPVARPRSWRALVEMEGGWEDNTQFQQPNGAGDRITGVRGSLQQSLRGGRGELLFSALGEARTYATRRDLDRFTYQGRIDGTRVITPRLSTAATVSYVTIRSSELLTPTSLGSEGGEAASVPASAAQGLPLLPLSTARSVGAGGTVAYRMSALTTGSINVGYTGVTFDSPELLPGRTLVSSGLLAHRYGADDALLLSAEAQEGSSSGRTFDTRAVAVGWQPTASWGGARFLGGATRSSYADAIRVAPSGSADVHANVEGGVATVQYVRALRQAYGLGQLLVIDQVGVNYDRLTRAGLIRLSAAHAWGSDAGSATGRLSTNDSALSLRRTLAAGVTIGSEVAYRDRGGDGDVRISGSSARVILGYGVGGGSP